MVSEYCERIYKIKLRKVAVILCGLLFGIILCSHTAYADETSFSSLSEEAEGSYIEPSVSLSDKTISAEEDMFLWEASKDLASQMYSSSDVRATDYTQLIYNYLSSNIAPNQVAIYQQLGGNASVTLYKYVQRIANGLGMTSNTATGYFAEFLSNFRYNNFSSGPTLMDMIYLISSYLTGAGSSQGYDWDTLVSSVVGTASNTAALYNNINTTNNNINAISTKLSNYISLSDITWTDSGAVLVGAQAGSDINGTFVNTAFDSDIITFKFNVPNTVVQSVFSRISLPIDLDPNMNVNISMLNTLGKKIEFEYFLAGRTLYLLGFPKYYGSVAYLVLDFGDEENYFNPSRTFKIETTTQNNLETIQKISNFALLDINHKLSSLVNELASPDIQAAKEASKETTDAFLDDFTGSGSSSAKASQVHTASDISDSVASGLSTGENADSALVVFNPANALFGWFSQDCASYFTPYTPSRSIQDWNNVEWTDDMPTLTPIIEQNIYDLTEGDNR